MARKKAPVIVAKVDGTVSFDGLILDGEHNLASAVQD
jgi:hypothetical protein